jgi:hypothetical protein
MPEEDKNKIPQFPTSLNPASTSAAPAFGDSYIRDFPVNFNQTVSRQAATSSTPSFSEAAKSGMLPISVAGGTIYATPEQTANMNAPRTVDQRSSRSPAEQQALLAQMRERGSEIAGSLAGQGIQNYYTFRQGIEERRAQEALTPSAYEGGVLGKDRRERAAKALVGAERWKQAASGQREAMDTSPISAFGGQFRMGSMGQFSPIQRPSYTTQGMQSSMGQFPQPLLPQGQPQQSTISMGTTSGTPFSFTPFAATSQSMADPFRGLRMATSPQRRNPTFNPLPFGLRTQPA